MGLLGVVLLVCLLQTVALAYPTLRSRWRGWRLSVTVLVLFFGTVTFMSQIESLVYLDNKMPPGMLPGLFLMGLFNAVLFSPILVVTLGKWQAHDETGPEAGARLQMPWWAWGWKLAVGATVFLAFYYLFGYYIAWQEPAVREYYGGTDPGSFVAQMRGILEGMPRMLAVQWGRGLLWVLLALPVIRMMKGRWWEAGLAVSLLFTVPVFYLLFPNPLMPEAVRMAHVVETAPYQFLFGWFVVWLFTRRPGGLSEDAVRLESRDEAMSAQEP